jgi:hypothetical protein
MGPDMDRIYQNHMLENQYVAREIACNAPFFKLRWPYGLKRFARNKAALSATTSG